MKCSVVVSLLLLIARTVYASGSPPTISAGVDVVLTLPAYEQSVFGTASDPEDDDLTYTWSQVSGPAGYAFSAPWALHQTIAFTQTGTYVFRLTVLDGSNTVTDDKQVTVNPASSQTAFYVDPTYTGGSNDGSAASPWTTLAVGATSAQWIAINNALVTTPVIIYFSARQAGSDISEVEHNGINLWRTDTSTNRLTLDGMSKYNSNDVIPAWGDNVGASRFQIDITNGPLSIGVQSNFPEYPMHYTTIRGFDITGCSGRVLLAGNSTVLEYLHVHDITCEGATVQLQAAVKPYPDCTQEFGNLHDITFRNMLIERGEGEALYIGGNYIRTGDGGCPSWGNTHSDILIEGNTIHDPGFNGGQGDGIDLKAGLMRVTVRGNSIFNTRNSGDGLTALGVFAPARSDYLIEQNRFAFLSHHGISVMQQNWTTIRNNLIYPAGNTGIYLAGDPDTINIFNVSIYNNTVYMTSGTGIGIGGASASKIRNNIIFGICSSCNVFDTYNSTGIASDYNVLSATGNIPSYWFPNETNSITLTSNSGVVMDTGNWDFHLVSGSPAINVGVNLSATGFANDADSTTRPQETAWDIGAYEYFAVPITASPVMNFRVVK